MTDSFKAAIEDVKARLREAAGSIRRLRMTRGDMPSRRTTFWPEVVRRTADAYGYESLKASDLTIPPSPQEIDDMDEAIGWLLWLENGVRQIVWARACNITWRRLEMQDGRSRETLRKLHDEALATIVARLVEGGA